MNQIAMISALNALHQLLSMLFSPVCWALLTLAVLIWYSSVTVYVAIRGSFDIKHMLRKLSDQQNDSQEPV